MLLGIIAGLATCALWGLTFVAARAVTPFTAWDLTIARYCFFGLACLMLMADRRFRPVGIARPRLLIGLLLGGAGYVGYFIKWSLPSISPVLPCRLSSSPPCLLPIIANIRDRSAPWKVLAVPLAIRIHDRVQIRRAGGTGQSALTPDLRT
jgi:drug/metabolite transporter (DMT)-like permease